MCMFIMAFRLILVYPESADFSGPPSDLAGERRLRLASSSPDVKALFNAPAYIYNLEDHEEPPQNPYVPGPSLEYWTPLQPIVCRASSNLFLVTTLNVFQGVRYTLPHQTR